jgi:hypothetical protein
LEGRRLEFSGGQGIKTREENYKWYDTGASSTIRGPPRLRQQLRQQLQAQQRQRLQRQVQRQVRRQRTTTTTTSRTTTTTSRTTTTTDRGRKWGIGRGEGRVGKGGGLAARTARQGALRDVRQQKTEGSPEQNILETKQEREVDTGIDSATKKKTRLGKEKGGRER